MPGHLYTIRQCQNPRCHFRYPVKGNPTNNETCPRCGKPTEIVETTFNTPTVPTLEQFPENCHIEVILDNIRSAFNVGAMFRTADGTGLHHLHLCGMTPTPENPKVGKTALGAEYCLPWSFYPDSFQAADQLKNNGYSLWALEGGANAVSIFDVLSELPGKKLGLIIGNEVSGVDPGLLAKCEQVIYIPMLGYKRSLNVAIAFGIAVYYLRFAHLLSPGIPPLPPA